MEATDIKIKIKQTDKTFDVTIKSNMNILQVKEIIGAQINTKPAEMKLIYKGNTAFLQVDTVTPPLIITGATISPHFPVFWDFCLAVVDLRGERGCSLNYPKKKKKNPKSKYWL